MRINWVSALDWIGLVIWLVSLIILPFLKLHIPNYLWIFPVVSLALTIAYRIGGSIIYIAYINIGIILIYLAFVIILVKLWLYLVAGLILFGLIIVVFQWTMGREWRNDLFVWLMLIILLIIIMAIGGAIVGPILVLTAQLMRMRGKGRYKP
ncbi:MAG: hypothetical protein RXO28_03585 [Thermocladium sp.]|jgi:hypothetical protein